MSSACPTLFDRLAHLPDPRSHHGRIHPLSAVLGLCVLAMLSGRTSLIAIARFGRQHGTALAQALGFRRGKTPTPSTLSRTLRRIDPQQLEDCLSQWIAARIDPKTLGPIAIDGKVLRGSRDGQTPGVHLLAAYAPHVSAVLAQIRVEATTNEHKAALQLLGILPLSGRLVTADAIFCQKDLVEQIVDSGGDYLVSVKDNQPSLLAAVEAGFGYEDAARQIAAATSPW